MKKLILAFVFISACLSSLAQESIQPNAILGKWQFKNSQEGEQKTEFKTADFYWGLEFFEKGTYTEYTSFQHDSITGHLGYRNSGTWKLEAGMLILIQTPTAGTKYAARKHKFYQCNEKGLVIGTQGDRDQVKNYFIKK